MIVALKTDQARVSLSLVERDGTVVSRMYWQAKRQLANQLLAKLEQLLHEAGLTWGELDGIAVYQGAGQSFTGLRIGVTVANSLAQGLAVPLAGGQGRRWRQQAVQRLVSGANDYPLQPRYGRGANITQPKK